MAIEEVDLSGLNVDAVRIITELLPEWQRTFEEKAREYGQMHRDLGIRAQYVDLHRKAAKLQQAWWHGADTSKWREQPREIAMDMIGHLFLAVALLDREEAEAREQAAWEADQQPKGHASSYNELWHPSHEGMTCQMYDRTRPIQSAHYYRPMGSNIEMVHPEHPDRSCAEYQDAIKDKIRDDS